jgi:hypothetical protein
MSSMLAAKLWFSMAYLLTNSIDQNLCWKAKIIPRNFPLFNQVESSTTVHMKILWDVTLCMLVDYRRFRGTYRLYLLGRRWMKCEELEEWPWTWRQHIRPKCRWRSTILHGFISQKTTSARRIVTVDTGSCQSHMISGHTLNNISVTAFANYSSQLLLRLISFCPVFQLQILCSFRHLHSCYMSRQSCISLFHHCGMFIVEVHH